MQDAPAEPDERSAQRPLERGIPPVPTLDREVLANLRGLPDDEDDELLNELINLFLQDAPSRVAQIRAALLEGNATTASQVAHSLKGSSGNLGARAFALLCNQIEQRCQQGDLECAKGLQTALEEEFRRVLDALEAERRKACAA